MLMLPTVRFVLIGMMWVTPISVIFSIKMSVLSPWGWVSKDSRIPDQLLVNQQQGWGSFHRACEWLGLWFAKGFQCLCELWREWFVQFCLQEKCLKRMMRRWILYNLPDLSNSSTESPTFSLLALICLCSLPDTTMLRRLPRVLNCSTNTRSLNMTLFWRVSNGHSFLFRRAPRRHVWAAKALRSMARQEQDLLWG